jgi:hypothetical protein
MKKFYFLIIGLFVLSLVFIIKFCDSKTYEQVEKEFKDCMDIKVLELKNEKFDEETFYKFVEECKNKVTE